MLFLFLGLLFLLLLLGIPVAFALGLVNIVLLQIMGFPFMSLVQKAFYGINQYPLLAIPFYLFVGEVMNRGGIAQRLVDFSSSLIGDIVGDLGHVNILASIFFGGISGSAVADTSAVGGILIPAMVKGNYPADYSAAVTMSSSVIGILVPPSIPFILYGIITNTSITRLFMAGIIPGILVGLCLMVANYFISKKNMYGYKSQKVRGRFDIKLILNTFRNAWMALTIPIVIIGGILSGVFTPTEAGVISAFLAAFLSLFVYKGITIKELPRIFLNVAKTTSIVMFLCAMATVSAWLLTRARVPFTFRDMLLAVTYSPLLVMMLVNILLLLSGLVLDFPPAMLILAPIFFPVMMSVGFDPVYFGVIMCFNLAIGLITPPVGTALYVASGISGASILKIAKANIPLYLTLIFVLILLIVFPQLVMFIPNRLY